MAMVWADGFEHYGGVLTELSKAYSINTIGSILYNTGNPRTGKGYISIGYQDQWIKRTLNTPATKMGVGFGYRPNTALPTEANTGVMITRADNSIVGACAINAGGGLSFFINGTSIFNWTALVSSANNLLPLGVWSHIEFFADPGVGPNTGYLEARINGITVLTASGLAMSTVQANSFILGGGMGRGSGTYPQDFADLIAWDGTGTINNNFLGDRRCVTSLASANGVQQVWNFVGGATAFQSINSEPPGANYIEGVSAGDISEFQKGPLTVLATGVAGVRVVASALKTDAGAATVQLGLHSGAFVANGPAITPGLSAGYVDTIIELDPNGNIPWTKASFEAATLRVTKG